MLQFLEHLNKQKNIPNTSVMCFAGTSQYPLLFFTQIKSFLAKNNVIIESIALETTEASIIKASLATMSLSGKTIYWFNDFYLLPIKKQQEWCTYFQSYEGPHTIIFFNNEDACFSLLKKMRDGIIVSLPAEVSLQDISMIRFLLSEQGNSKQRFAVNAGLQVQMVSLDTLCLFSHYELVIGKNWDYFLQEWGAHIIEPTSSLFLLSQYFFGKKVHLFFPLWSRMQETYMPTFWPSFWADQAWRAYVYCDLMKQKKYTEAKKAQYKLPYSLINRDWSLLRLQELHNTHNYAYSMDYRLKNGCSPVALELFFSKFFDNKFR